MAAVTKTAIADGAASNGAIWNPAGAPVAGDVIDLNDFDVLWDESRAYGVDDGGFAITNSQQYPAGALAKRLHVAAGVTLTLRGTLDNSNGGMEVEAGGAVLFTNSDAQVLDIGNFDNVGNNAPRFKLNGNAYVAYVGSGSMRLAINQGGSFDVQGGGCIVGFGTGAIGPIDMLLGSDAGQSLVAQEAFFVEQKGHGNIQCYGDGTMGDIDIDGLHFVAPVSLPGVAPYDLIPVGCALRFDGYQDSSMQATLNTRKARNITVEGRTVMRFMQNFQANGAMDGFRSLRSVLFVDGVEDCAPLHNAFFGDTEQSFVPLSFNLTDSYAITEGDNGHIFGLHRFKSVDPEITGNVFEPTGTENAADTSDVLGIAADSQTTDYLTANQRQIIHNNLVLPSPFNGVADGSIFVTVNGTPTPGNGALHQPKLDLENNTVILNNVGAGSAINEAGVTPTGLFANHKRNIYTNIDRRGPQAVAKVPATQLPLVEDDIYTPANSDENVFDGLPDGIGLPMTAAHDANSSSEPAVYADPTRNFKAWALRQQGVSKDQAKINFIRAGFQGCIAAPTVPAVSAAAYSVDKLRRWVREGWVDTNPNHAGRGITDAPPAAVTDVNGGNDLQDGVSFTLTIGPPVNGVTKVFAHHEPTGTRQEFLLGEEFEDGQQNATTVQGDLPHGVDLQTGVVLDD